MSNEVEGDSHSNIKYQDLQPPRNLLKEKKKVLSVTDDTKITFTIAKLLTIGVLIVHKTKVAAAAFETIPLIEAKGSQSHF